MAKAMLIRRLEAVHKSENQHSLKAILGCTIAESSPIYHWREDAGES